MNELESNLQKKESSELQRYLKNNMFNSESTVIAKAILKDRGATIPEAISEDVIDGNARKERSASNKKFLLVLVTIALWIVYGFATGLFETGQEKRFQNSIFIIGLFLASELGWIALGNRKGKK
jgi:hypothetical protein